MVFPDWKGNAFLNILELIPRSAGYEFCGADTLGALLANAPTLRRGDVLHIHWTNPIVQDSVSQAAAKRAVRHTRLLLRLLRNRGVSIVWTIHNALPHEVAYRQREIDLYGALASAADVIHVMSPQTRAALRSIVDLPASKVTAIPHPSYAGIYENGVSRESARAALGLSASDYGVLFFGQIRPYKGVSQLVDALTIARSDVPGLRLLIAGPVVGGSDSQISTMVGHLRTTAHLDFVDDSEVATWFRAADLAVFPYRSVLNSGSAHLALSLGTPVLLPASPTLLTTFAGAPGVSYFETHGLPGSLARAIAQRPARPTAGETNAWLEPISPMKTSLRYLELLEATRRSSSDHSSKTPQRCKHET